MNTEFGLEPFEDARDERAHQIIVAHLAQASPAEQFCFVQRSNYDDNARALRWLADRPETDRAAILAMYWNLGADWLMQFAAEADVPDYERASWQFCRLLEARYTSGFYPHAAVYFNPYETDGAYPFEYDNITRQRETPPAMLETIAGEQHVDVDADFPDYDEGLPLAVAEAVWALYDED